MILFWLGYLFLNVVLGLIGRTIFFAVNGAAQSTAPGLREAFLLGARFDLTVACYGFAIPSLIIFVMMTLEWAGAEQWPPWKSVRRFLENSLTPFLALWMALVALITAVDIGYFMFYQDRINVIIFGFVEDDTWAVVKSIWKNYPLLQMVAALVAVIWLQSLLLRLFRRRFLPLRRSSVASRSAKARAGFAVSAFLFFLVNGMGARGSLGLFPLSEMDTHVSTDAFVNLVAYNPVHSLSRAIQNRLQSRSRWNSNLKAFGYGEDATAAWADCFKLSPEQVPEDPRDLLRHRSAQNPWAQKTKPHVLVLVLESFGTDWLRYQDSPFNLVGELKSELRPGQWLSTYLSATAATVGSLSSLMAGVPHRPYSEFLTESEYLGTPLRTSPARIFKKAGYQARFLYAGNPGWRDIGKYALTQGFDHVEGDADVEKNLGRRLPHHDWGLFDEDFWEYLERSLLQAETPQFVLAMTTANHPPFELPPGVSPVPLQIPEELRQRIIGDPAVALQRFQTYRHANDQLGKFLKRLRASSLGSKTIVAATGDHGFWLVNFPESQQMQRGAVPLILSFPPGQEKKFAPDTFGSHMDLWPTLYETALDRAEYDTLGVNLLDPKADRWATNFGQEIVGPGGFVFVGVHGGSPDRYLTWKKPAPPYTALEPAAEVSDEHLRMARRYRCSMSLLDDLFRREKKSAHER